VTRVSARDICRLAYELFQARGSEHGHDIDDWLLAQAELRETQVTHYPLPRRLVLL
jgi:hypothetical protein